MVRKKIEPIETLGKDTNKLIVQKSLPLFALWRSDLSLSEFKILDTYLARINSHEPQKRKVTFSKGELEDKLGVTKINKVDLEKRLIHLMGNVVKVPDNNTKRGFKLVTLFEEVEADQDETGLWTITLECTQKAMKYFFNVDNLGYLRYKLRCITPMTSRYTYIMFMYLESNRFRKSWQKAMKYFFNVDNLGYLRYKLRCITPMTSRYTYIMFMYLESNRFRKSWEVDLDELKQILNCDTEETYKQFKRFNDLILKKIQKELHEKTECRYAYEPIKRGRKVVAIKFNLETLKDIEELSATVDTETKEVIDAKQFESLTDWDEWIESYCKACDDVFSTVEMEEFIGMLNQIPLFTLYPNTVVDDIAFKRHEYISEKYRALKVADSKKPIKNKYKYLKKMIESDIEKWRVY